MNSTAVHKPDLTILTPPILLTPSFSSQCQWPWSLPPLLLCDTKRLKASSVMINWPYYLISKPRFGSHLNEFLTPSDSFILKTHWLLTPTPLRFAVNFRIRKILGIKSQIWESGVVHFYHKYKGYWYTHHPEWYLLCTVYGTAQNNRDSCVNHYDCSDMSDLILIFWVWGVSLVFKLSEKHNKKFYKS